MNGYYYLSENQILALIHQSRSSKDPVVREAVSQLDYQLNHAKNDYAKYRLAASNKLSKLDSKSFNNDELSVDDDALVSCSTSGAHVLCWVWVENDKPKRTRKRVTK